MVTKVPKFHYRPDLNTLELDSNPSPLRPWEERTTKKADPTAGAKYVDREQRTYEAIKLPGYETPEKSDVSYKKLKEKEEAEKVNDSGPVKYDKNGFPNKASPEAIGRIAANLERMRQMEGKPDKPKKKINTYADVKIPIPTINHSLLRKSVEDKAKAAAIERVRQYAFSKRPDPDITRGVGSFANTIGKKLRQHQSKKTWEQNHKTTYEDNSNG